MKVYECAICGNTYDEGKEGALFDQLDTGWECGVCGSPKQAFSCKGDKPKPAEPPAGTGDLLAYPDVFARAGDETERAMDRVHQMAVTGESVIEPMRTRLWVPGWDDILFLGAQLASFPLEEGAPVETKTMIGKSAKKPMEINMPVFVTHMSFGALSKEMKVALSKGSALCKTAMCSGEGGILPEEREAAYKYIFEYVPNLYSANPENIRKADAIEIKIGQGTKPGMGGHLPGEKVTAEIAGVRGKKAGEDIISPSRFAGIENKEDLKKLVDGLREESGGRPIGIKIAAGHIEADLAVTAYAKPDFITIDGRGGGTGASPAYLKDASSVPTVFALHRARKFLDAEKLSIDLIITGGLRTSGDIIKALCMGADAVAIGTAALMAGACQQYRVCHTGKCPTGTMTQDPELRKNLDVEKTAARVANFLDVIKSELQSFARVSGHENVHDVSVRDLCTVNSEVSNHTDIPHA